MPIIRNNRNTVVGRRPALRLAAVSAGLAAAAVIPAGCNSGDGKSIGEQTGITKTVSGLEVRADKVWGDNGECPVGATSVGDDTYRSITTPKGDTVIFDKGFVGLLNKHRKEIASLSVSSDGKIAGVHYDGIKDYLSDAPFDEVVDMVAEELGSKIGECEELNQE